MSSKNSLIATDGRQRPGDQEFKASVGYDSKFEHSLGYRKFCGVGEEAKRYSKEASDKWVSNILLNEYQAIEAGASKCMDY